MEVNQSKNEVNLNLYNVISLSNLLPNIVGTILNYR